MYIINQSIQIHLVEKASSSIYITRTEMRFFVFLADLFLQNEVFSKKLAEINEKYIS
jgi:hypothetical protein